MQLRRPPPAGQGRSAKARIAVAVTGAAAVAGLASLLLGIPAASPDDAATQALRLDALAGEARGLAAMVEAEVGRREALLAALAASPALDRPAADLRALDLHARAAAGILGAPIAVADRSLARLADTAVEFGTPLPGLGEAPAALRALETGRAAVEAAVGAEGTGGLVIAVPVRRNGENIAVVASRIRPPDLLRAPGEAALQAGAETVALADAQGRVIASAPHGPDIVAAALAGLPAERGELAVAPSGTPLLYASSQVGTAAAPAWRVIVARAAPPPASAWWSRTTPARLGLAGLAAALAGLAAAAALGHRPRQALLERTLRATEAALRSARAGEAAALHGLSEMRRLHDTIPVGLALLGHDLQFVSVNAKFASIAGILAREHSGRRPSEVLPASLAGPLEEASRAVFGTGRPVLDLPLSAEAPGMVRNERHFLASCHPAFDGEERIAGVSIVLQDVTERVRAEKARELLVRELNHRVKNTLATVQSIASVTLRQTDRDPRRLTAELTARLRALARAHDLLTAHAWEATELSEVARAALAPWLDGMPARLSLGGPPGTLLRPGQAQALVLALHELATNAVKYGALSGPEGRVSLLWQSQADGRTVIEWRESGGPAVVEPPRESRGFGTRLLERALASDLGSGAEVRLDFAPAGLQARISFPNTKDALKELLTRRGEETAGAAADRHAAPAHPEPGGGWA